MFDPAATPGALPRIRYVAFCGLLGLMLGWLPSLLHGPIPEKYAILHIDGKLAVWGWYTARLLIGFYVGIAAWPHTWFLRGALWGFLAIFPLTLVSLATPGCGLPCMTLNLITATAIGVAVAGAAKFVTGRESAYD